MTKVIIHQVGNKLLEEGVALSSHPVDLDKKEDLTHNLKTYFLSSFREPVFYNFHHVTSLELNEVYTIAANVFESRRTFVKKTQELARIFYEYSNHPRIKSGELYIAYFEECTLGNEVVEAIGIYKAENKETFLTVRAEEKGLEVDLEAGISINRPDKGCLIFNTAADEGYKVLIIDNQSGNEAQYWKDEFLKLRPVADNYHQTRHYLELARDYVTGRLDEEFEVTKTDQIDYLNRSLGYFKKHEQFNELEFAAEVFEHKDVIKSFKRFKNEFAEENDLDIVSEFEISNHAVKRQARIFKSVLKLDKNFHIYIHGDRDLIERGVDPDGRKYYKIYYREES
ncbi:MAG TPA: nucleoid-associated protein [Chryseosolibacter sp.]|nr:nucleoid-associated protein [Chryseosolibacter sp.]